MLDLLHIFNNSVETGIIPENCKSKKVTEIDKKGSRQEPRNYRPIIIIIIIKRDWQCKAGRERLTPYQSEDPNPTTPTHRKKEEKGKTVGDKM